jgi:hypothetical protein
LYAYPSGGSAWLIDSGATNHLTGDEGLFASLEHYDKPIETIIYGDNGQGDVVGLGKIVISTTNSIYDFYHVQGLGYNLLSVSQLCEKGYNCLFTIECVIVSRREDSSIVFTGQLRGGELYYADFTKVKVEPKIFLWQNTTWVGYGIAD